MALLTKEDVKQELQIDDAENDDLLQSLAAASVSLWEFLTDRTAEETEHTEYHNSEDYGSAIFLQNRHVSSTEAFTLYDDTTWSWGSDTLIGATEYRVDYVRGIVYYESYFSAGKQNLKVTYTAGYTTTTLPAAWKEIFARQAAHWFRQAVDQKWDISSLALPEGAGTTSYKVLKDNLLPDFVLLATREARVV